MLIKLHIGIEHQYDAVNVEYRNLRSPVLLQEPGLIAAAEQAWDLLAGHPATAAAAGRMATQVAATPARAAARLGRSGWNAYSFNVDYRTGASCSTWPCTSSSALLCARLFRAPHASTSFRPALSSRAARPWS